MSEGEDKLDGEAPPGPAALARAAVLALQGGDAEGALAKICAVWRATDYPIELIEVVDRLSRPLVRQRLVALAAPLGLDPQSGALPLVEALRREALAGDIPALHASLPHLFRGHPKKVHARVAALLELPFDPLATELLGYVMGFATDLPGISPELFKVLDRAYSAARSPDLSPFVRWALRGRTSPRLETGETSRRPTELDPALRQLLLPIHDPEGARAHLEAQVQAHPDALEPRHVLADWLSAQGDPRGEFIELQLALDELDARDPHHPVLARARALLARFGVRWLGPWACRLAFFQGAAFRRGSLAACDLSLAAALPPATATLERLRRPTLDQLRAHPFPSLRELECGADVLEGLLDAEKPWPRLHRLVIIDDARDARDDFGPLAHLVGLPRFGRPWQRGMTLDAPLRRRLLRSGAVLPALRTLAISTPLSLDARDWQWVLDLGSLQRLELRPDLPRLPGLALTLPLELSPWLRWLQGMDDPLTLGLRAHGLDYSLNVDPARAARIAVCLADGRAPEFGAELDRDELRDNLDQSLATIPASADARVIVGAPLAAELGLAWCDARALGVVPARAHRPPGWLD